MEPDYSAGNSQEGVELAATLPKLDFSSPLSFDKYAFLREIVKSKRELVITQNQFNYVSDPALVDHIVFRMGAAEQYLNYLLRLAREWNMEFDGVQWEWFADEVAR